MNPLSNTITHSEPSLPSPPPQSYSMTRDQHKYCIAIMRNLKKHRDAAPFLNPVDYVKLNVPDYPNIITNPMDLLLVDKKLNNSEYATVDDFVSDVRLVFNNCFKYNGPEAMISVLCQNVESAFEKGLRQMPPSQPPTSSPHQSTVKKEPSPPLSQHSSPPQQQQEYFNKPISEDLGRPKREIHCPSKDYPETYTTQRKQFQDTHLKYCLTTLKELKKNKYRHLAYPFLEPVDPVALNIPDYFTIIKRPMDLSTIETKLMNNQYKSPEEFEADVTLMFDNCYLYNPPSLPIHGLAKEFEKVFKTKWAARPKPVTNKKRQPSKSSPSAAAQPAQTPDRRNTKLAELERHLANISEQIESIKSKQKAPVRRAPAKRKKPVKKQAVSDSEEEDEFSFEEKKRLSEQINELTGDRLNTVVAIIQDSMPNLGGNGQEEIVLDIDALDKETLRKLNEFVNPAPYTQKCVNPPKKKQRSSKEKLRELQQTLKKFTSNNYESSSSGSESADEGADSSGSSSSDSD